MLKEVSLVAAHGLDGGAEPELESKFAGKCIGLGKSEESQPKGH